VLRNQLHRKIDSRADGWLGRVAAAKLRVTERQRLLSLRVGRGLVVVMCPRLSRFHLELRLRQSELVIARLSLCC